MDPNEPQPGTSRATGSTNGGINPGWRSLEELAEVWARRTALQELIDYGKKHQQFIPNGMPLEDIERYFPQLIRGLIIEKENGGTMSLGEQLVHEILGTQNENPGVVIEPLDDSGSEEGPIDLEPKIKVFRTPASSSMQQDLDPQDGNLDEQNVEEEVEHDGNRQVELNALGNGNWVANSIANLQYNQVAVNGEMEQIDVGESSNIQATSEARGDDEAMESGIHGLGFPVAHVEVVCDEDDNSGSEGSTHIEAVEGGDGDSSVDHRAPKKRVERKVTNALVSHDLADTRILTRSQTRQINEPNQVKLAKRTPIASTLDSQLDIPLRSRSWSRSKKQTRKSKRKSKLSCQVCGKLCANKGNLTMHLNGLHHVRIVSLKCEDCEKEFANAEYLRRHRKNIHNPDRKKVNCPKCKRVFVDSYNLTRHLPYHGRKKFKCPHCPKVFYVKSILNRHVKTHSDRIPLECSECHKNFLQKSSLKRHFLGHMQS